MLKFLSVLLLPALLAHAKQARNYILPNAINDTISIDTTVGDHAHDRPYISSHNLTTYEWWYFDAVSSDGQSSIVISSLVSPTTSNASGSQIGAQGTQFLLQVISGDGVLFDHRLDYGSQSKLYVSTKGDGSSGVLGGGDLIWVGKPDLSEYVLNIDLPQYNISGTVTLLSAAEPFVGCDPFEPEATTQVFWWFNWINLMGDAVAIVDVRVGDKRVAFTGNGYHDKNWGPVNYAPYIHHWYWGHGRAGDYSIVWSRVVTNNNETKAGGWIAKDGKTLWSTCVTDTNTITVQPFGDDITYPPNRSNDTENIEGFHITIDAGDDNQYAFTFEKNRWTNERNGNYARWIGNFTGGKLGEELGYGVAVTEQMGPFNYTFES